VHRPAPRLGVKDRQITGGLNATTQEGEAMKRGWLIGGALLIGACAVVFLAAQLDKGRVFIAGDQPVSTEQVKQKLLSDGWSNIQVSQKGRFIMAVASRNGEEKTIEVEAQTGRLRISDDDDPVNDEEERK
jgi:hypothetical protein